MIDHTKVILANGRVHSISKTIYHPTDKVSYHIKGFDIRGKNTSKFERSSSGKSMLIQMLAGRGYSSKRIDRLMNELDQKEGKVCEANLNKMEL